MSGALRCLPWALGCSGRRCRPRLAGPSFLYLAAGCCLALLLSSSPTLWAAKMLKDVEVLGFTPDGRWFLFILHDYDSPDALIRLDVRTTQQVPVYGNDSFLDQEEAKRQQAEREFLAKNPPRCAGGMRSPDGRSQLRIRIFGGDGGSHQVFGGWEKQSYQFGIRGKKNEDDFYLTPWMVLHGFLQAEGRETRLVRWGTRGEWGLAGALSPCWSPDGRRVALLFARSGSGIRDWGSLEAIFRPTRGPRIQVLLPPRGTPPLSEVVAQIEAQGFLLSSLGKAAVRRPSRTVVQYGEGFAEVAQKLARQLGDGRALEKVSQVDNFDVVIRLGAAMPSLRQ